MANLLYNLAQPFSDTKQYTQGAIVIYNDRMYEMTADEYTPGPFDPEKFTERFLSEMISGKLNSNLMQYAEGDKTDAKNGVEFTINCGFKPDIVIITVMSSGYINYYDSKISETIGFRGGINYGKYDIKSTVANGLRSINDDGFTASFGTATNLTFHWQAIKLQR